MSILDTLLGRKKRNTATIAEEIVKQERAVADGRALIEQAKRDRQAAMEAMDDAGHKNADEAIAAARRDIERREHAVEALKAARAEREIAEAREAYRSAVTEAAKENDALAARIQAEYSPAANTIAGLMEAIRMAGVRRAALVTRARELGEQAPEYSVSCDGLPHAVGNIPSIEKPGALLFMNQMEALKLMSQPRDVF